ncbi:hypothetical protein KAR91_85680 [Candidatus Pacearchaeota archaeon]|nr:hypothetical protein [Candidatus Pacearchaeota archaeon]
MRIKHWFGGKFAMRYDPLEMECLNKYVEFLQNPEVKTVEDLLAYLFEKQVSHVMNCLQMLEPPGMDEPMQAGSLELMVTRCQETK